MSVCKKVFVARSRNGFRLGPPHRTAAAAKRDLLAVLPSKVVGAVGYVTQVCGRRKVRKTMCRLGRNGKVRCVSLAGKRRK